MALQVTWFEERNPANGRVQILEGSGPFVVGRAVQSDIELPHEHVSRQHVELSLEGSLITVIDKSQNGTFLEGRRIESAVWTPGELLRVGPFALEVQVIAAPPRQNRYQEPQTEGPDAGQFAPQPRHGQQQPAWEQQPFQDQAANRAGNGAAASQDWVPPQAGYVPQSGPAPLQQAAWDAPAPAPLGHAFDNVPRSAPPADWHHPPGQQQYSDQHGQQQHQQYQQQTFGEPLQISWAGDPWSLVGLSFKNWILTILTLGIYSFWAKTELRKRVWSSIRVQGEPLAYTGTGGELFKGALIVYGLFLLLGLVLIGAFLIHPILGVVFQVVFYVMIFVLIGIGIYRARRYRLSRTVWRGIRGGMAGSDRSFSWLNIWTSMFAGVTFGLALPYRHFRLQKRLNGETMIGTQQMTFEGSWESLFARFMISWGVGIAYTLGMAFLFGLLVQWLLPDLIENAQTGTMTPPSIGAIIALYLLGILWFAGYAVIFSWYQSRKLNTFASFTGLDQAKFSLKTTAGGLIGLILSNLAILFLSLGILAPIAYARAVRYFVSNLTLEGTVDVAKISQNQSALGTRGEGLAQALDVDAF